MNSHQHSVTASNHYHLAQENKKIVTPTLPINQSINQNTNNRQWRNNDRIQTRFPQQQIARVKTKSSPARNIESHRKRLKTSAADRALAERKSLRRQTVRPCPMIHTYTYHAFMRDVYTCALAFLIERITTQCRGAHRTHPPPEQHLSFVISRDAASRTFASSFGRTSVTGSRAFVKKIQDFGMPSTILRGFGAAHIARTDMFVWAELCVRLVCR